MLRSGSTSPESAPSGRTPPLQKRAARRDGLAYYFAAGSRVPQLQIDSRWTRFARRAKIKKKRWKERARRRFWSRGLLSGRWRKKAPFRRALWKRTARRERCIDLGIAVALDDDRLATAVVTRARKSDCDFVSATTRAKETRGPRRCGDAPLVITPGRFGVRAAAPIVVQTSIGRLVGSS